VIHAAKAVIGAARHRSGGGNNRFDAGARREERVGASQVTIENFYSSLKEALSFGIAAAAARQGENLVIALLQFESHIAADEACGTCDENDHGNLRRKLSGSFLGTKRNRPERL